MHHVERTNEYGLGPKAGVAVEGIIRLAVSGELAAEEQFSTNMIASQLEISRTPVREALAALAFSGVVAVEPQIGTKLLLPSRNELEQAGDMCLVAEQAAALEISRGNLTMPRHSLRDSLEMVNASARSAEPDSFLRADTNFHRTLLLAGGQTMAARLTSILGLKRRLFQTARPTLDTDLMHDLYVTDNRIEADVTPWTPSEARRRAVYAYYTRLRQREFPTDFRRHDD